MNNPARIFPERRRLARLFACQYDLGMGSVDPVTQLLRHTLATLCYRGGKTLRDASEGFSGFRAAPGTRTPGEILAHIGDLLDWALHLADGRHQWNDSPALDWNEGTARFFRAATALDRRLASGVPLVFPAEKIFQGPIADALTHFGQIAILRRMAGCPIRGENYFKASIAAGQATAEQPLPVREFD
jgi:hypothetical protein